MKRLLSGCIMWSLFLLLPALASAAPITAYVEPFSVVGSGDPQLSTALQTMLITRLNSEKVQIVDGVAGAQARIKGTYIQLGKVFSVDVTARNASGEVVARAFEQGEGQEAVFAAVTALGEKVSSLLSASPRIGAASAVPAVAVVPQPTTATASRAGTIKPESKGATSDIIKTDAVSSGGVISQRLAMPYDGMALLRNLPNGERELAIFRERTLKIVRFAPKVTTLAEVELKSDEKILAVDSYDLDGDNSNEIYLTVMRQDELASQVWDFKEGKLVKVAEKLPYYFRVVAEAAGGKILYAQEMGRGAEDFYGPAFQLKKTAKGYELQNPLKLPKFANIFNFSRLKAPEGASFFVVLHPDGFLIAYDEALRELWRSNDKFGGSEVYFKRDDQQNQSFTGDAFRKVFLQQRLVVTKDGDILVPQNSGIWNIGNSRSYSKSSLFAFSWSGAALEEKWHTRQDQAYLADYFLDDATKEVVLLEVVQKAGLTERGGSTIGIRKIE